MKPIDIYDESFEEPELSLELKKYWFNIFVNESDSSELEDFVCEESLSASEFSSEEMHMIVCDSIATEDIKKIKFVFDYFSDYMAWRIPAAKYALNFYPDAFNFYLLDTASDPQVSFRMGRAGIAAVPECNYEAYQRGLRIRGHRMVLSHGKWKVS